MYSNKFTQIINKIQYNITNKIMNNYFEKKINITMCINDIGI